MQNTQNFENQGNQDISRNHFANDPIKAGTRNEKRDDEGATLTDAGVSLKPEAAGNEDLPEDEQTTLNTSGVQEGEKAGEGEENRQERESA
jgi:hypothetical protein